MEPISFDGTEEKKNGRSTRRKTVISTSPPPAPKRHTSNRNGRRKPKIIYGGGDSIANEEDFESDIEIDSFEEDASSQVESALLPPSGKTGADRMGVFTGNQPDTDYKFVDEKRKV
jgi:hypothetical protein